MVPNELVRFSISEKEIIPHYLLERDHAWLRALLDAYLRYEGRPRRELSERLAEPLPVKAPIDLVRIACHVLDRLWRFEVRAAIAPRTARAVLFGEQARLGDRDAALRAAAVLLGDARVDASLFADLPGERIVTAPRHPPNVSDLAQRANLALVAGMLRRAVVVSITARSNLRAIVRQAKLKGLLCTVRSPTHHGEADHLEISGPFTLFRRTLVYGRALATLVPFAMNAQEMELRASCRLGQSDETHCLVVREGDPLPVSAPSQRHDSRVEEHFFEDFSKIATGWDVVREPVAIPVDRTLIFPDFELRHRRDPNDTWLVEIVGFWTPSYVRDKLRRLRQAHLGRFILCIDENRNCTSDDLPPDARVVRYRRRIDAKAVRDIVEPTSDWARRLESATRSPEDHHARPP